MTFILSIETDAGTYQHGYHLGTIESVARDCAQLIFHKVTPRQGTVIRTVALMVNSKMFDCYDGSWSSEEGCEAPGFDAHDDGEKANDVWAQRTFGE